MLASKKPASSFLVFSNLNGSQIFQVDFDPGDTDGYLSLQVASTSTSESLDTIELKFNCEEGFEVRQGDYYIQLNNSSAGFGVGTYSILATPTGYDVSDPVAFRAAIDFEAGIEAHEAEIFARTTNPNVLGQIWNDGGTLKFSSGPSGQPFGLLLALTKA